MTQIVAIEPYMPTEGKLVLGIIMCLIGIYVFYIRGKIHSQN